MTITADTDTDWMQCELIERIPGKVSGRPIVRGTRILPDAIVDSYDLGAHRGIARRLSCAVYYANQAADRIRPYPPRPAPSVKLLLNENLDHALRKLLGPMRSSPSAIWAGPG